MSLDRQCYDEIQRRLKRAGEWRFARGRPDHPPFKGAERDAQRLLQAMPDAQKLLVMRDAVLRPVREAVLDAGRTLVVPDSEGKKVWIIPQAVMLDRQGKRIPLRIDPMPRCALAYNGSIDAVVVGCLGFSPTNPYLYSFDTDRTAGVLDSLRDGTENGFHLGDVPVIAVAADCQQVDNWPDVARSYVRADLVITPTRLVQLRMPEKSRKKLNALLTTEPCRWYISNTI